MNLTLPKNDRKASWIIWIFSIVVFVAVTLLERVTVEADLGFDPQIFAKINAIINTTVAVLLVAGLISAKARRYELHKKIMLLAIILSVLFLVTYVLHHLFAGSTLYGDINNDEMVDASEKAAAGTMRYVYFFLLGTHIIMAGISLPFILFTAYRALINENSRHRKIAKVTWPMWFYVAVTGPLVYLMISRYY